MNFEIIIYTICYFVAGFGLSFSAGVREGMSKAQWISLIVISTAAGATNVIAFFDKRSGRPPGNTISGAGRVTALIVAALVIASALTGCAEFPTEIVALRAKAAIHRRDLDTELWLEAYGHTP